MPLANVEVAVPVTTKLVVVAVPTFVIPLNVDEACPMNPPAAVSVPVVESLALLTSLLSILSLYWVCYTIYVVKLCS